jgi:hypothetical protein
MSEAKPPIQVSQAFQESLPRTVKPEGFSLF